MWRIKPYKVSNEGWSVGIQAAFPLLNEFEIYSNALVNTGSSNNDQYFTFTPKESSNIFDGTAMKPFTMMMVAFEFEGSDQESIDADIAAIENMSNYYYKLPAGDQSCAVDRFECYPL